MFSRYIHKYLCLYSQVLKGSKNGGHNHVLCVLLAVECTLSFNVQNYVELSCICAHTIWTSTFPQKIHTYGFSMSLGVGCPTFSLP